LAKNPPRLEALLDQVLQALDHALGLRVRRLAEVPIDGQLPAERRVFLRGATLAAVQPGLAIPDQQLRKRAQGREDQRASTGALVVPTPDCGLCSGGEGFEPSWTARSPRCAWSTLSGACLLSSSDGRRSVPRLGASSSNQSTPRPRWGFRASSAGDRAHPRGRPRRVPRRSLLWQGRIPNRMATEPPPGPARRGRLPRRPRHFAPYRLARIILVVLALIGVVALALLVLGLLNVEVVTDHFSIH
jgi:hypothetical protein